MKKRIYRSYGAYGLADNDAPVTDEVPWNPTTQAIIGAGATAVLGGGIWALTYYATEPKKKGVFAGIAVVMVGLASAVTGWQRYKMAQEANEYYLLTEGGET